MEKSECPRCESPDVHETKSWELKGGKGGKNFVVHQYKCIRCDKSFRKLEEI